MSVLLFSLYISLLTLLSAAGYALLMSTFKREISQRWVLGELIVAVVSSFGALAITALKDVFETQMASIILLVLLLLSFAVVIFAFFSIRSPRWSEDEQKVSAVRKMSCAIFALSVAAWGAAVWFF